MEQLDIFSLQTAEQVPAAEVYARLEPALRRVLDANNAPADLLVAAKRAKYMAVGINASILFSLNAAGQKADKKAISNVLARIYEEDGGQIWITQKYEDEVPVPEWVSCCPVEENFRIAAYEQHAQAAEYVAKLLDFAIDAIPKDFDCCGFYKQCSECGSCKLENRGMALKCGYRKILKSGRNIYKA